MTFLLAFLVTIACNEIRDVADSVGTAAQYRYDASSNLTEVWDGRSNITRFSYGPNDEPTGVTWPDERTASALYDAAGRLRQTTDERGIVANYKYNGWEQLNI